LGFLLKKPKAFLKKTSKKDFFETMENKAKRQGDSKKKGGQERSENFLGFQPTKT